MTLAEEIFLQAFIKNYYSACTFCEIKQEEVDELKEAGLMPECKECIEIAFKKASYVIDVFDNMRRDVK